MRPFGFLAGPEQRRKCTVSTDSYVEHALSVAELRDIYTDSFIDALQPAQSDGLSVAEAEKRLRDGGPNLVQQTKKHSKWRLLLNQHFYKFWILLIGASLLSVGSYSIRLLYDVDISPLTPTTAFILIPVVLALCGFTVYQEQKTMDVVATNEVLLGQHCYVVRDCGTRCVRTEALVVGDLLQLRSGQKLPADVRILQSNGLKIDLSLITGSTAPVPFTHEAAAKHVGVFGAYNTAFQGTFVTEGDGIGLVIRTGKFTFLGNMADIYLQTETTSLMREDIHRFVNRISGFAILFSLLIFLGGCVVNHFQNVLYYFVVGFLVVIVALLPQGLPPAMLSHLAIITKRLARQDVYIRNLDAIDELGAATTLVISQSGLLTTNQLTLRHVWFDQQDVKIPAVINSARDLRGLLHTSSKSSTSLETIMSVMGVCNLVTKYQDRPKSSVKHARALSMEMAEKTRDGSTQRTKNFIVERSPEYRYPKRYCHQVEFGDRRVPVRQLDVLDLAARNDCVKGAPANETPMSPVDEAMYNFLKRTGVSMDKLSRQYRPIYEVPFNSVRQWQLLLAECVQPVSSPLYPADELSADQCVQAVMMKGAPEVVLEHCSRFLNGAHVRPVDDAYREECKAVTARLGQRGEKVVAFALKFRVAWRGGAPKEEPDSTALPRDLVHLGLASMNDPPRPETADAIEACKQAGIKLYVVSGDHPVTAMAMALKVGLITDQPSEVSLRRSWKMSSPKYGNDWALVLGNMLEHMERREWDCLLKKKYVLFARTTPAQARHIVDACQERGEVVGFAGGGVNDAPTMAQANIGITTQAYSTDVAQKAADIILHSNTFASLTHAIAEGRLLFDNMQLSIAYTLAHLWPEVCPIMMNFALGLPLALTPLQILTIDMGCELPPAISLAYEKPEQDIMKAKPRSPHKNLVGLSVMIYSYAFVGTMIVIGSVAAYFSVYHAYGIPPAALLFSHTEFWHGDAQNLTSPLTGQEFTAADQVDIRGQAAAAYQITLVLSQVFHIFLCTTRRASILQHGAPSRAVVLAVLLELALLAFFVYAPVFHQLTGLRAPPAFVWAFGPMVGASLLVFTESRKYLLRHGQDTKWAKYLEF